MLLSSSYKIVRDIAAVNCVAVQKSSIKYCCIYFIHDFTKLGGEFSEVTKLSLKEYSENIP